MSTDREALQSVQRTLQAALDVVNAQLGQVATDPGPVVPVPPGEPPPPPDVPALPGQLAGTVSTAGHGTDFGPGHWRFLIQDVPAGLRSLEIAVSDGNGEYTVTTRGPDGAVVPAATFVAPNLGTRHVYSPLPGNYTVDVIAPANGTIWAKLNPVI